jgi:hypothetical protein
MKAFKEYLQEGVKKYDFRVKIAGDVTKEHEQQLETLLQRFKITSFKKTATTPVQQFPLDFPKLQNQQVSIYEVVVDYPTTTGELTEYISSNLKIAKEALAVRSPGEPTEEYQEPKKKREGALLDDNDYKESPNAQFEDFYGDKYNSGFVKELNDILKLQRKERGEQIPTDGPAKFNTDSAPSTRSPLQQAQDPRK